MLDEDQQKREKKQQMRTFVKKCWQYIVNNKIQLPILDEYLKEHSLIFQ
jgi:hypothetical protein